MTMNLIGSTKEDHEAQLLEWAFRTIGYARLYLTDWPSTLTSEMIKDEVIVIVEGLMGKKDKCSSEALVKALIIYCNELIAKGRVP